MDTATVEDAGRVALVAVREERQTPRVFISEVPKPAQVEREISVTLEVFLACFAQPLQLPLARDGWLDEGVDVAQCPFETDAEPVVPAGVKLSPVLLDAPLGSCPDCIRDAVATEMWSVNPGSPTHSAPLFLAVRPTQISGERPTLAWRPSAAPGCATPSCLYTLRTARMSLSVTKRRSVVLRVTRALV